MGISFSLFESTLTAPLRIITGLITLSLAISAPAVMAESSCVYVDQESRVIPIKNINAVPMKDRARVVCKTITAGDIADPEELKVGRDTRNAVFTTDLGPMRVRWSRSIEKCFSTSPARAVSSAAQAVNKALKSGRFASQIKSPRREWSLAFIDKTSAISQFPLELTAGRHPGFMIPPSKIYIVPDIIAADCQNRAIADEHMAQVLLHEMGHVIEYLLLGERESVPDRQRAEGFASWFEQYSADYASVITEGRVSKYYQQLAAVGLSRGLGGSFSGSAEDYAVSALQFKAIVAKKGISGLMRIYELMRERGLPWLAAVEEAISWDRARLQSEMRAAVS